MHLRRRHSHDGHGFTLVEVLIVVFIISVLASLVIPRVISAMSDSKVEAAKARGSEIFTMIVRYNQFHPGTEIALVNGPISATDLGKLVEAQYCTTGDLVNQVDAAKGWSYLVDRVVPTP